MQDSVVVDVGRSQRTIAGAKRRALVARDKHCRWRQRHHWLVHEGGWQIIKSETGELLPVAPMLIFRRPRGPD